MKLNEEERNLLVELEMEKAKRFLFREKGDYNCHYSVMEEEIETIVEPTKKLIQRIE